MSWLHEAAETVGEALFPTNIYCVCCGSIIDETRVYGICDNCIEKFQFATEHLCEKCGKILSDYTGRRTTCFDCRYRKHSFRKGYTCAGYGLYERAMIMDLKYQGKAYFGKKMGKLMAQRMLQEEELPWDVVIPVPVHPKRLSQRGYNQSRLLAKPVAEALDVPLMSEVLLRSQETKAMKDLGAVARIENMKQAFSLAKDAEEILTGKEILLVDDIYTTGATVDACSAILLNGGAAAVDVLTFAAGGDKNPSQGEGGDK